MQRNFGNRAFLTANYYRVLSVPPSASEHAILHSFRKLQRRYHTDRGGDHNVSLLLNEAKRILLDPELRREYDRTRPLNDAADSLLNPNCRSLPPAKQLSTEIRTKIERLKEQAAKVRVEDNLSANLAQIVWELKDKYKLAPAEDVDEVPFYYCVLCNRRYVSEHVHFDQVLASYVKELLSSHGPPPAAGELAEVPIIAFLQKHEFGVDEVIESLRNRIQTNTWAGLQEWMMADTQVPETIQETCSTFIRLTQARFGHSDPYSLGEGYRAILRTYPSLFSSVDPIHIHWAEKFFRDGNDDDSFEAHALALAALHYMHNVNIVVDLWVQHQRSLTLLLERQLRSAVDQLDYHKLKTVLHTNTRARLLLEFLQERQYDLNCLQGEHKATIAIISGSHAQLEGNVLRALRLYDTALEASIAADRLSSARDGLLDMVESQLADFNFHTQILHALDQEMLQLQGLTMGQVDTTGSLILLTPDQLKLRDKDLERVHLGRNSSPTGQLLVARRNETAIADRFQHDHLAQALAYFDLTAGVDSVGAKVNCFMVAIAKLLELMVDQMNGDFPTAYAYHRLIEEYCTVIYSLSSRFSPPNSHLFHARFIVSTLTQSARLFLASQSHTASTEAESLPAISTLSSALINESLEGILRLSKTYPLGVVTPFHSVSDRILRSGPELRLLTSFVDRKCEERLTTPQLPAEIYAYHKLDSYWRGWSANTQHCEDTNSAAAAFKESRLYSMLTLLESKKWDLVQVERTMQYRLVRRTRAGWLDNEQLSLDFDGVEPTQLYTGCAGFELNFASGMIEWHLEQDPDKPTLFTAADVLDIMEKGLGAAMLTLENPDPKLDSHPFQEYRYWPPNLHDTDYLLDLLHADYLLKQITTGVEVSANAPFELRPASEGFMQRLPEQFQSLLKPVLERRRDPINVTASDAHRFWIQVDEIEAAVDDGQEDKCVFRFGAARAAVHTRLLRRNPGGEYEDVAEQHAGSAEAQLAQLLTAHYDEIGHYFPLLLRLKELTKLSLVQKKLISILRGVKANLATLDTSDEIRKSVAASLDSFFGSGWDPPHPIYTEARVQQHYHETLALNGLVGKEHQILNSEIKRVKTNIRNDLAAADQRRFAHCAQQLATAYRMSTSNLTVAHVQGCFEGNSTSRLVVLNLCTESVKNKKRAQLTLQIEGIEAFGIRESQPGGAHTDDNNIQLSAAPSECNWVPAAFWSKIKKPTALVAADSDDEMEELEEECRTNSGTTAAEDACEGKKKTVLHGRNQLTEGNQTTTVAVRREVAGSSTLAVLGAREVVAAGYERGSGGAVKSGKVSAESSGKEPEGKKIRRHRAVTAKTLLRRIREPTGVRPPRIYGGVVLDAKLRIMPLVFPPARVISCDIKAFRAVRSTALAGRLAQRLVKLKLWPSKGSAAAGGRGVGSGSGSGAGGSAAAGGRGAGSGSGSGSRGSAAAGGRGSGSGSGSGGIGGPTMGPGKYRDLRKGSSTDKPAHHILPHAVGRQFGIRKDDGISVVVPTRKVHMDMHAILEKYWRSKELLVGRQKAPRFDPNNPETYPRNQLGQAGNALRKALIKNGMYGAEAKKELIDAIRMTKETQPNLFDKGTFDPNSAKPPSS